MAVGLAVVAAAKTSACFLAWEPSQLQLLPGRRCACLTPSPFTLPVKGSVGTLHMEVGMAFDESADPTAMSVKVTDSAGQVVVN